MQKLLFLSRVAFICNVCLFLTWLSQFIKFLPEGFVSSTVIVMGLGMSFLLNMATCIVILVMIAGKRSAIQHFPRWLIIANFLFLIPQLILLLK